MREYGNRREWLSRVRMNLMNTCTMEHVYSESCYGSRDVPNGIDQLMGRGWVHE